MILNRIHYILILSISILNHGFTQGLRNNGARIVFAGPAQMVIAGATGNYSSTAGGLITPSSSSSITLAGNWINNSANIAFTTDGGAVVLNGANQTIGGTNSTAFFHLTLSGSGIKTLAVPITTVGGQSNFTGVLSLNTLALSLNSNRLDITNQAGTAVTASSGYIISETNAAVNPSIVRWYMRNTTGSRIVPFGLTAGPTRIPLTFNVTSAMASTAAFVDFSTRSTAGGDNQPWAGASNVGGVGFFFCPNLSLTGNPCAVNSAIDRWWDISPSHSVTSNVTFVYRGVENTLTPPYNTGNIGAQFWDGSYWNNDNATIGSALAVTAGTGAVTANALNQFCPFILSSVSVPLPVEMVSVDVKCENNNNLITWTTASETNSKLFVIERSLDAINFIEIGKVNAAGNSQTTLNYAFTDDMPEKGQINYYRVKEIDLNNNTKKYKIVSTANCGLNQSTVDVMNTQNGEVFITVNALFENEIITFKVFDLLGKLIKEEQPVLSKGLNKFKLSVPGISQSVYMLNITGSDIQKSQKIILNGE